jgi:hypothetical protein
MPHVCRSPDTWEYELSHVLDIYSDDFIHRAVVALTQWQDIPLQDKNKAYELVIPFVDSLMARVGQHSVRSSSMGLAHDNMNLYYRACQRAGRSACVNVFVLCICMWLYCCLTQGVVLYCNLKNFHVSEALKPEDVSIARQTRDDLKNCIGGAQASGHSKESLPVFIQVHQKMVDLVQLFEAQS